MKSKEADKLIDDWMLDKGKETVIADELTKLARALSIYQLTKAVYAGVILAGIAFLIYMIFVI